MSYAIPAALLAVPAIGFGALAVDLGMARCMARETQAAADSAALAAATYIGDAAKTSTAAVKFATMNKAGGLPIKSANVVTEIGTWSSSVWTASASGKFVRVTVTAEDPPLLSWVFGTDVLRSQRTAIAQRKASTLCGLIGFTKVDINTGTATIDGYDSTIEPVNSPAFSATAGVCSNHKTELRVRGSVSVFGTALAGPGGTVSLTSPAIVSNGTGALSQNLTVPTVTKPSSTKALPSSITTTTTLTPGVYYIKGNFSVSSTGKVVLTGDTEMYVEGNVQVNNTAVLNTSKDPRRLKIYIIGNGTAQLQGDTFTYAAIYAPAGKFDINNQAVFYGIAAATEAKAGGSVKIHLDTSMASPAQSGQSSLLY